MLEKVSLLVQLSISVWVNTSRSNLDKYQTLSKYIVPPEAIQPIQRAASRLRAHHYNSTLPWQDSSIRILPSKNFFEYKSITQELIDDFKTEVNKFTAEYDKWVNVARVEKNDPHYKAPPIEKVREMFGVNMAFLPFPTADDFRIEVLQDYEKEIKASCTRELTKTFNNVPIYLLNQIIDTLDSMMGVIKLNRRLSVRSHRKLTDIVKDTRNLNITNNVDVKNVVDMLDTIIKTYIANREDLNNDAFKREAYFQIEAASDAAKELLQSLRR